MQPSLPEAVRGTRIALLVSAGMMMVFGSGGGGFACFFFGLLFLCAGILSYALTYHSVHRFELHRSIPNNCAEEFAVARMSVRVVNNSAFGGLFCYMYDRFPPASPVRRLKARRIPGSKSLPSSIYSLMFRSIGRTLDSQIVPAVCPAYP